MIKIIHTPVLVKEVLQYLNPAPGKNFIDGTVGEGGHAIEILQRNGPSGRLLGIDADPVQISHSEAHLAEFKERVVLVNDSYVKIDAIAQSAGFGPVHGILVDLGYSSRQMEKSGKGFSFMQDEPLDMRYSGRGRTAAEIVNEYHEKELARIIKAYGEERFAARIAKHIVEQRQAGRIERTLRLAEIITHAIPARFRQGRIHCATRTFQALRIAVNQELENVSAFLSRAMALLAKDGRLVVISFHSLEDRIVKYFFKTQAQQGIAEILTKKPVTAGDEETSENPRSRSAKLRAIKKL